MHELLRVRRLKRRVHRAARRCLTNLRRHHSPRAWPRRVTRLVGELRAPAKAASGRGKPSGRRLWLGRGVRLIWSPVTPWHFAWQAWHKLTSTVVVRGTNICGTLRGRCGSNSYLPSFCVAAVALMAVGGALGLIWSPVTPRHFASQAWHKLTSTIVLRGRRGTNSHLRHFAWQVWHKLTSTAVLRGSRGTNSHLPSFCAAGVALMAVGGALGLIWSPVTPWHFAWQVWHKLTSTVVLRGRCGTNSHLHCRALTSLSHTPSFTRNFVIQIHTYTHTHIHTYTHTYIHTYTYIHIHTYHTLHYITLHYMHTYYLFTYLLALSRTVFHMPLCHTQLF